MEKTSPRLEYETPYLAKLAHSFPRFDLSLRHVNATFLPNSYVYKEVLSLTIRRIIVEHVLISQ